MRDAISAMESQRINQVIQFAMGVPDVIPLWFGESDIVTPDFIRAAAIEALNSGKTFYVNRRGILPLREEIKSYLDNLYALNLDLNRITVVASGMTAIMIAAESLLNNEDNMVVVSPIWPNIFYAVRAMGAECRHVRLENIEHDWHLDLDKLFAACDKRTRAIFIASPGNPTGWVISSEQQKLIIEFCRLHGIWIIADEVYHRLVYNRHCTPSFLDVADPEDSLFVVQSFSKSWAMTGWRLGWLVHPSSVANSIGDLSAINNTGASSFVQYAGIAAIRHGESFIEKMVKRCRRNRDLVYERLSKIDQIQITYPEAAFYAFFSVDGVHDDLQFAKTLAQTAHVGLAPGSAFGPGNEGYLRLCFAHDEKKILAALDRLENAIINIC